MYGKSTIFNALTGLHQHTGNWPGKTVSNASGTFSYRSKHFLLVDIPGTYSLMSNSQEEEIARDYICFGNPDATIVVVDATCLERNLNLVFQIMEITDNVIVCVNLLDEAKKKHIKIDLNLLSDMLGVPVVGTIARKKSSLNNLLDVTYKVCQKKICPKPKKINYNSVIEDCITKLENKLKELYDFPSNLYRWISLKLLENETDIISSIEKHLSVNFSENIELEKMLENLTENGNKSYFPEFEKLLMKIGKSPWMLSLFALAAVCAGTSSRAQDRAGKGSHWQVGNAGQPHKDGGGPGALDQGDQHRADEGADVGVAGLFVDGAGLHILHLDAHPQTFVSQLQKVCVHAIKGLFDFIAPAGQNS